MKRGTGAAPASGGLTQPRSPGGTRADSSATRSRPGPTTVKGIKAKMPRWRAERRGVHRNAPFVRSNPDNAPGAIRALRLVGAPTPSPEGGRKKEEVGRIPAPSNRTGADILLPECTHLHVTCCLTTEYVNAAAQHSPFVPAQAGTKPLKDRNAWPLGPPLARGRTRGEVLSKRNQRDCNGARSAAACIVKLNGVPRAYFWQNETKPPWQRSVLRFFSYSPW